MTPNEALNYLGISHYDEANDAIEETLFSLRQQIIAKGNLPQLLDARKKKLNQLKQIKSALNIFNNIEFKEFKINYLNSFNLIDCFNNYEKNKAIIFKQISSQLSIENLENCIDNLNLNIKIYCSCWPQIDRKKDEQVFLSNELESMEMLAILKNLESENICTFSDLSAIVLPEPLAIEIKRLNLLKESFD